MKQANLRLGQLLLKNHHAAKAEPFLLKANQLVPDNFEVTLSLADAYQENSKDEKALNLYYKADNLAEKSQNIYTKLDKLILHNNIPEKKEILDKLGEQHVYESLQEIREYSNKLIDLTEYFDEASLEVLRFFLEDYDPYQLHSRDWWEAQLNKFGDVHSGHDKILRGIHSAVFSWSLPDKQTLSAIANFAHGTRLYSYGAGSALWEHLLSEHFSIDVIATDFKPRHSYLPVKSEDYSKSRISERDTIFLSWIIRGDLGVLNILNQMVSGQKLILVGEPRDEQGIPRICATPEMFQLLDDEFTLVESIPLVSYSMLNDTVSLYIKK